MATAYFSAVTGYMQITTGTNPAFVLENSAYSRVSIKVKKIIIQVNNISINSGAGGVMPMFRGSKRTCTSSGGVLAEKVPYDTTKITDSGVFVRFNTELITSPSLNLVVSDSSEPPSWQQFTSRMVTAAEQHTSWDSSILPNIIEAQGWKLYPGQCLVVESVLPTTNTGDCVFFCQCVWEEDDSYDVGYTVSGVVTLDSSPVSGATVFLLQDLTTGMAAPKLDVLTTNGSGQWSKTLASGVKAAAFVQHKNGSIMYSGYGKPYLEKP